jgi:hypothetical protein
MVGNSIGNISSYCQNQYDRRNDTDQQLGFDITGFETVLKHGHGI